ncbi:maternal embryonic leucine zipper kinase isoform X1 [Hydra vulgaris]|uniref:maternal embryonic leucine zipper kinase isoform X1 n=1 Tax=Hydra vulgaris TaxID=6087 RepID=UPI0032EA721A
MPGTDKFQSFTVTLPPELSCNYEDKNKELGQGGFAKVVLAEHIITNEKVAIKVMDKKLLTEKDDLHRAYNEIDALKNLVHPHICQLYEVFENKEFIYLVLEYCPGGELFDYIVAQKRLSEKEGKVLFFQIISAVSFMHKKGYAHRDLKPENMLLDGNQNIKIIDFGLSAKPGKGLSTPLKTRAGSAMYASPELISGAPYYGNENDVWSLGVVLYALLCGFLPFEKKSTDELYKQIKKGEFAIPPWLSQEAVSLLKKMLEIRREQRIKIKEILSHDWLIHAKKSNRSLNLVPDLQTKKLKTHLIELIAAHYGWSKSQAIQMVSQFKYDNVTAFYLILCNLTEAKLKKFANSFSSSEIQDDKADKQSTFETKTKDLSGPRERRASTLPNAVDIIIPSLKTEKQKGHLLPVKQRTQTFNDSTDIQKISKISNTNKAAQIEKKHISAAIYPIIGRLKAEEIFETKKEKIKNDKTKRLASSCIDGLDSLVIEEKDSTKQLKETRSRTSSLREFTNRLSGLFKQETKPRRVKAIYHVENTSTLPADDVCDEIERVLKILCSEGNIISYSNPDRYLFKCKSGLENKTVFELEVCRIPYMDSVVGIRSKRLKGDAWNYKEIIELVLSMMRI